MKAVIYARYSSENQREESIEGQLRECKEYADYNDIEVVGEYIDRALTAKTDNRPGFQRMIQDCGKKLFDLVLVWKLDRFARNRYDSAFYRYTLRKNGIKIISVKENISDGPEGIILESMIEGMAEYYSANLSQNVKRGFHENALKGKWNGGAVPLGYKVIDHKLVVDEETAPIVSLAFQLCADGKTAKEVYNYLKENVNPNKIITSFLIEDVTLGGTCYKNQNGIREAVNLLLTKQFLEIFSGSPVDYVFFGNLGDDSLTVCDKSIVNDNPSKYMNLLTTDFIVFSAMPQFNYFACTK